MKIFASRRPSGQKRPETLEQRTQAQLRRMRWMRRLSEREVVQNNSRLPRIVTGFGKVVLQKAPAEVRVRDRRRPGPCLCGRLPFSSATHLRAACRLIPHRPRTGEEARRFALRDRRGGTAFRKGPSGWAGRNAGSPAHALVIRERPRSHAARSCQNPESMRV